MDGLNDADELTETERRQQEARQQADADLRAVLSLPAGRRFVYGLVYGLCGLKTLSLSGEISFDSANEGQRRVGKRLEEHAERAAPDTWDLACAEAIASRAALRRTRSPEPETLPT